MVGTRAARVKEGQETGLQSRAEVPRVLSLFCLVSTANVMNEEGVLLPGAQPQDDSQLTNRKSNV